MACIKHWNPRWLSVMVIVCILFGMVGCTPADSQESIPSTTAPLETTQPKPDLSKPLALQVLSGDVTGKTIVGTYSWNYEEDGLWKAANASGAHPLDSKSLLTEFTAGAETARLEFGDQPDHISVRCWSAEHFGDPSAAAEQVTMNGYTATLKPGSYVYEVAAQWDDEGGEYYGLAYYCFYVTYSG